MDRPLRVLHLEDDPNDRDLVRETLRAEGPACEVEVTSTREEFTAALERGAIDLILADFGLPDFDGLSALRIAQDRVPEIPFILVSGTLGEEAAIDSLRAGATDYVLKHRLARLVPAVRRALGESQERLKRRQAEEALQKEQQFLKAVLESLEAGVVACDSRSLPTLLNRAAREFHGLPAEAPPTDEWAQHDDLYHPDGKTPMDKQAVPLFRAFQGERLRNVEIMIIPRDGPARTLLVSGQPIFDAGGGKLGAVVAMHDITERKQLEGQLRQAQKMDAVGQLAGGVAHDFNNLLGVILGYSELLLARPETDGTVRGKIEEIRKAAERAASLTRQLLAFSRKQVIEPRVLDLNSLLAEMEKMLRRLIGEDIELVTRKAAGLGRIKADPGQIEQILMNLVVNARDAMPQGGTLTLETANAELDEAEARQHAGSRPGPYVMLAVSDSGTGMSPKIQARIFEPFFTTKEMGRGTGLGLATVYGIVKQNEGSIYVYSEPDRGSTFKIYLPRVSGATEAIALREADAIPRGTETVLLVEDEDRIRRMIRESLEGYGYTVLETGDPEEAVRICRKHRTPIHLLMTDVILPKKSGRALAASLTSLRPGLKVLYMSGYTDDAIARHGVLEHGVAFLQKPFALTAMARKVREVLSETGKGAV